MANAELCFPVERDGLPAEEAEVTFRGDKREGGEEKGRWRKLGGLRPTFKFEGHALTPGGAADYRQELDAKTGVIRTSWVQAGVGKVAVEVQGMGLHYEIRAKVVPERSGTLTGKSRSIVRTGVEPEGYCDLYLGFGKRSLNEVSMQCKAQEASTLTLTARFGHKLSKPRLPRMPEIIVDGPEGDQEIVDSLIFQTVGYSGFPGPFGGTNQRYYGHVFWDADAWVFPALALLDPEGAKRISDYRIGTKKGAAVNYDAWIKAGRPIGNGQRMVGSEYAEAKGALKYAWESGDSGKEVAPGGSRYQEHVSGTVVRSLETSAALGLAERGEVNSIGSQVAQYYMARMEWRTAGGLEMRGVMSPDEYHTGDNDLYTNMIAQHLVGRYVDATRPLSVYLPRNGKGQFLTYDGDKEKAYQQAAALLTVFPLQDREAEKQAMDMLERFGPKVIKNGPAMSDSLHALVRARFGDADVAYQEWKGAHARYAKGPFGFISERPTTNQTVFVTGAAGFLNTVIYGFAGIRVHEEAWPDAEWSLPLKDGWTVSGRASLPSAWKSVTIPDLKVLGKSYTLRATHSGSSITLN